MQNTLVLLLPLLLLSTSGYGSPGVAVEEHIAITPARPALVKKMQACNPATNPFNANVAGHYDLECANGTHLIIEAIPPCPTGTYAGYLVQGVGENKTYGPYCNLFGKTNP